MVYTEHAETAAVSRGASHVTIKQRFQYTTTVGIQNVPSKATVTRLYRFEDPRKWCTYSAVWGQKRRESDRAENIAIQSHHDDDRSQRQVRTGA